VSDQAKTTDQVKEAAQKANDGLEKAPDAPAVRNASKEQITNALEQNPNRTKGMTELAYRDGFVDSPDKRSMELEAIDKHGNKVTIDKASGKRQKDISLDPHPTRMMPAMTPEAEAKIKAQKQAKHEQISQSATLMAIKAGENPAMQAVALGRQHADSLPEGHPQKQSLTDLSRELAAKYSPEMKAHYEAGTHKAIRPENLTNTPDGWLAAAQKLAQLPMDKQLEVIGSGLLAGIEQYRHDERERAWGRLIGTVQGTGEVLQGLAKIADFGAACILGDNKRAEKMGKEFGTALGQTIVGGVRLFQAADQYLFNIGYTGDYAKPFRDIQAAGQKLDEQWNQLPPREQERIKAKLITEMIESGAIGAGGANAVQKASKFTEVLDALAVEAKQLHAAAKPTIKKAVKAINNAVDELVQPVGDTGMGVKMQIPKDPMKDETKMLMSKADDMGERTGRISKGVDASGKSLSFSEESGIEIVEAIGNNPDSIWKKGWSIRGFEGEGEMGSTGILSKNFPRIDDALYKDGTFPSMKTIDLSSQYYRDNPKEVFRKLDGYLDKIERWNGQEKPWGGHKIDPDEIEQKILQIGIPNGTITEEQKRAFEEVGKRAKSLGIKMKVTVIK
jgi:hypothetical protein